MPLSSRPGHSDNPQQSVPRSLRPIQAAEIADLINSAEVSIEMEERQKMTNETPLALNPYLSAAINASRRGVRVRVMLTGPGITLMAGTTTTRWLRLSTVSAPLNIFPWKPGVQTWIPTDRKNP